MSQFARVESIDALKDLRVALCQFAETVRLSLDEADAEIKRAAIWLRQEQHSHWKVEIRKRTELVTRAKIALMRKEQEKTPLGGRLSCVDEKKALALARRRLEEAQEKFENVRRWMRQLEQETFTYKATAQGLSEVVEAGVPAGLAQLDQMIGALESYAALHAPSEEGPAPDTSAAAGVQRPGEPDTAPEDHTAASDEAASDGLHQEQQDG